MLKLTTEQKIILATPFVISNSQYENNIENIQIVAYFSKQAVGCISKASYPFVSEECRSGCSVIISL
jgi:hypothetical protein